MTEQPEGSLGHELFFNRELSWLRFNQRVLELSRSQSAPLLERLRFLSIYMSNLDEFFMIRIGALYDQILLRDARPDDKTGMTQREQIDAAMTAVRELTRLKDDCFEALQKQLAASGVSRLSPERFTKRQEKYYAEYYRREVAPLLSAQLLNPRHPYPFLNSGELYVMALLREKGEKGRGESRFGLVTVPRSTARVIFDPVESGCYVLVEELVARYAGELFSRHRLLDRAVFRVTRNADLNLDEGIFDYGSDYVEAMAKLLKRRRRLAPVRLQISAPGESELSEHLERSIKLPRNQVFFERSDLDFSYVGRLLSELERRGHHEWVYKKPRSALPPSGYSPSAASAVRDQMYYYPYDSFRSVIDLVDEASEDKSVLSIKITLYRVARESRIVAALGRAAENGKEVTVVLELRARFDEENNIEWARRLEEVGCSVIYGVGDYKVHAKLLLITRRQRGQIKYISYIGTGNFNETTAALYTDIGLVTQRTDTALELAGVFAAISLEQLPERRCERLLTAPIWFKERFCELIDHEIEAANRGEPAEISFKCNSLSDRKIIEKLAQAGCAGVRVTLYVRGICCLRPGIPGLSDNVRVVSIVGMLLEHSRIYIFGPPKRRRVFICSGDLLTRNTIRRIEVGVEIDDPEIKATLAHTVDILARDRVNASEMRPDGSYERILPAEGEEPFNSQLYLYDYIAERAKKQRTAARKGLFRRIFGS